MIITQQKLQDAISKAQNTIASMDLIHKRADDYYLELTAISNTLSVLDVIINVVGFMKNSSSSVLIPVIRKTVVGVETEPEPESAGEGARES